MQRLKKTSRPVRWGVFLFSLTLSAPKEMMK